MSRLTHRALLPLTLPLLLLACGQQQATPTDDLGPYANGATYPWSYTAQPGTVTPLTLAPGKNNLFFEPILSATNGWGPIEINTSNGEQNKGDGRKMSVGGKTYDVGFGVHADSELRFDLKSSVANVSCTKLDGYVGVDDEVGDRGSVVFQIFLNDTKVFDSGVMTGKDGVKFYSVDLQGRTDLRMVVTNGGDNMYYDHADWIQPTVHCAQDTVTPPPPVSTPGTLDSSYGTNGNAPASGPDSVFAKDGTTLVVGDRGQIARLSSTGAVLQNSPPLLAEGEVIAKSVVQSDGKIIMIRGAAQFESVSDVLVIRLNPDLTLDTTFGDAGRVVLNLSIPANYDRSLDYATAVGLAPDGKIIVAGRATQPSGIAGADDEGIFVLKLNANGTRDTTFSADGVIYWQFETFQQGDNYSAIEVPTSVVVLPDGRFMTAGTSRLSPTETVGWAARYLPNGDFDTSYAKDGVWTTRQTPLPQDCGGRYAGPVLALPSGEVLVAGEYYRSNGAYIQRVSADGKNAPGRCFEYGPPMGAGTRSAPTDLAVTSSGQILVAGTYDIRNDFSLAVARFGADLSLDPTWGTNGVVTFATGTAQLSGVTSVLVQPDGRYLLTTTANGTYRLMP